MNQQVLFVCTANRCRSVMAAALFAEHAEAAGLDVVVGSAGFLAGGEEPARGAVEAMRRRGLDVADHVSTNLDDVDVTGVGIAVCMEAQHLTRLCIDHGLAPEQVFLAGELPGLASEVRRTEGTHHSAGHEHADAAPDSMFEAFTHLTGPFRSPALVIAHTASWEIDDPMGGPRRGYQRCAERLDECTAALVELLMCTAAPG